MISLAMFDLPTQSASGFIIRYILPRTGPPQLVGPAANKPLFNTLMFGDVILGVGHGLEDVFTGQNESVLLEVGNYPPEEVDGKVIKLISCQTGVKLGPDLVQNGAACFMGYTDDYTWVLDADLIMIPWQDEIAAANLMPVINCVNALLDGKTAQDAYNIEITGYEQNAAAEEDELVKACIQFNKSNTVLYGNSNATLKARPKISFPIPPPPLPPIIGI
ncbi:MAG: hypothetical protein PHQ43_01235 [Dehalococcoidales bacterium]|nr:hypothetical protein [Dehalococcoidales bacterium]